MRHCLQELKHTRCLGPVVRVPGQGVRATKWEDPQATRRGFSQNWVVLKHLKDLHTSSCRGQGPSLGSPKDISFSRIISWVLAD